MTIKDGLKRGKTSTFDDANNTFYLIICCELLKQTQFIGRQNHCYDKLHNVLRLMHLTPEVEKE